jgi:hypothetical protein
MRQDAPFFIMPELRPEPPKKVGWQIAVALATGISAALITVAVTMHPVHAAPPPHQLTLQCIRWHGGRLSVQDPHHMMRGARPYRVVHKQFGPPLYGGTLALGSCTLVREG